MYQLLGFDRLLPRSRYRAPNRALVHLALARIARPQSQRARVRDRSTHFGIDLPLEKVYRMMDHLDDHVIGRIQKRVAEAATQFLAPPLEVLFFDGTTLYFESAEEDALRQFGYSKDGKAGEVQVLLALVVTRDGLPVTYEVFGNYIPLFQCEVQHPVSRWLVS